MNEIKFTYQRTKEDVLAHSIWARFWKSKVMLGLNILFPAFGVYALIMSLGMENPSALQYVAIVYLMLYPVFTYFFTTYRVNRFFKNPEVVMDITTFTISVAGINIESDKGAFLLRFEEVHQVYETKAYFYIYVDRMNHIQIRKDILQTGQVDSIRTLFRENLSTSKIKFK